MNEANLQYLSKFLEHQVQTGKLYGSAISVSTGENSVFTSAHGDIAPNSICMLCSMTKPFTSVAAWILIERGMIDPMEPVSLYLPGFANPTVSTPNGLVPAQRDILIRDLFNMTSGISATRARDASGEASAKVVQQEMYAIKSSIDSGKHVSNVDILNAWGKAPLLFQPGERWDYGKNADILGGIIDVVSGKTLGEFFKQEIFLPLGMSDTGFSVPKESISRVARIGVEQENGSLKAITSQEFYGDSRELWEAPYLESGGGGVAPIMCRGAYSTLNDYTKFATMLLQKGIYCNNRILSPQTVEFFTKNQLTATQRKTLFPSLRGYGYANLMRVMLECGEAGVAGSQGEFGWDGALGTYLSVDLQAGIAVTYFQQKPADIIVRRKIMNMIYGAL